jgi:hypothetical protein
MRVWRSLARGHRWHPLEPPTKRTWAIHIDLAVAVGVILLLIAFAVAMRIVGGWP